MYHFSYIDVHKRILVAFGVLLFLLCVPVWIADASDRFGGNDRNGDGGGATRQNGNILGGYSYEYNSRGFNAESIDGNSRISGRVGSDGEFRESRTQSDGNNPSPSGGNPVDPSLTSDPSCSLFSAPNNVTPGAPVTLTWETYLLTRTVTQSITGQPVLEYANTSRSNGRQGYQLFASTENIPNNIAGANGGSGNSQIGNQSLVSNFINSISGALSSAFSFATGGSLGGQLPNGISGYGQGASPSSSYGALNVGILLNSIGNTSHVVYPTQTTQYTLARNFNVNGTSVTRTCSTIVYVQDDTSSGTISASDCTIPAGDSTCDTTLNWTSTDLSDPQIRNARDNVVVSSVPVISNQFETIPRGNTTFTLSDGGNVIDSDVANASCVAGTSWDGSACVAGGVNPGPVPECADGLDNDGDGYTDWSGNDAGCSGPNDNSEDDPSSPAALPVFAPTIDVVPAIVRFGQDYEVRWDPQGNSNCSLSSNITNNHAGTNANVAGTVTEVADAAATYSIDCGSAGTAEATVRIIPALYET